MRRCKHCKLEFPEKSFGIQRSKIDSGGGYIYHRKISRRDAVCRYCRQNERDEIKRKNRLIAKARGAIRTHSEKFVKRGIIGSSADLVAMGWVIDVMQHEIDHQYQNGCSSCHHPYQEMGHGLWDITLDIWDPRQPPVYGQNTRWICSTCNKRKGDMTPEEWAQESLFWAEWERRQEELKDDEWAGTLLSKVNKVTTETPLFSETSFSNLPYVYGETKQECLFDLSNVG